MILAYTQKSQQKEYVEKATFQKKEAALQTGNCPLLMSKFVFDCETHRHKARNFRNSRWCQKAKYQSTISSTISLSILWLRFTRKFHALVPFQEHLNKAPLKRHADYVNKVVSFRHLPMYQKLFPQLLFFEVSNENRSCNSELWSVWLLHHSKHLRENRSLVFKSNTNIYRTICVKNSGNLQKSKSLLRSLSELFGKRTVSWSLEFQDF